MANASDIRTIPTTKLGAIEYVVILFAGSLAIASSIAMLVQGPRDAALILAALVLALSAWSGKRLINESRWHGGIVFILVSLCTTYLLLGKLAPGSAPEVSAHSRSYWMLVVAAWLLAWAAVEQFSRIKTLSQLAAGCYSVGSS